MDKNRINYWIDMLIGLSFIVVAATGLVLLFVLQSSVGPESHMSFGGIMKITWVRMHDISGLIFIILTIIHFILHWNWIAAMTKKIFKKGDLAVNEQDIDKEQL